MVLKKAAESLGVGIFAGVVGTAAMTASSTLEMKLRRREASTAPARAAAKILGVTPNADDDTQRFSTVVHWSYGTMWGAVRGLIGAVGLRGPAAAAAHLALVWGTEAVMLPALDIGVPPVTKWGLKENAIDLWHHLVYVTATSLAYEYLSE